MIFKPELAEKVLRGEKTVTRRMPSDNPRSLWYRNGCSLREDRAYSVQPGRGKPSIGKVHLFGPPRLILLGYLSEVGARTEGFDSPAEFEAAWKAMHGKYDPGVFVWRLSIRVIHPDDCPPWEAA